jgi:hypothetical protein
VDFLEKSFASASETSKLLITLSTGVIAFCVAVVNVKDADKTLLTPVSSFHKWSLAICWLSLMTSIGMGVWTQLAITDVLSEGTKEDPADPRRRKITVPYILQILSFLSGILVLVVYGMSRLSL